MTDPRVLINGIVAVKLNAVEPIDNIRTGSADLWELGDVFIVRCNVGEDGRIAWYEGLPKPTEKVIYLFGQWFQRDGVIVIPKSSARLSDEAVAYIREYNFNWSYL